MSLFLAVLFAVATLFGAGGVSEVRADNTGDDISLGVSIYGSLEGMSETFSWAEGHYGELLYFGENNKMTVKYGTVDSDFFWAEQKSNDVIIIDKNKIEKQCAEHGDIPTYIIIGKRIYAYGESFTISKDDIEVSQYGRKEINMEVITDRTKNQWYRGFWLDENGVNSYKAYAQWKGSGSSCWYEDSNGWYPTDCWQLIFGYWYYFKSDGYCAVNEWCEVSGDWYYFDEKGHISKDCWVDGYYIGGDGTQKYEPTGSWKSDANGWWFEDTSGWYANNGFTIIDGYHYWFKSDGYMAVDEWIETDDTISTNKGPRNIWYHFDANGHIDLTGNYTADNNWNQVEYEYK